MEEKQTIEQEHLDPEQQNPLLSEQQEDHLPIKPASRPRTLSDSERPVQRGREKISQREAQAMQQLQGDSPLERPIASVPGSIQRQERLALEPRMPDIKEAKVITIIEDRETVKWAAWGALLMSLITIFLLGLYSARDFSPEIEFHDLEIRQKKVDTDVAGLKYNTQLDKIKTAVTNAHFQLLVRRDFEAADMILTNAKEDLNLLITSLSVEKRVDLKPILNNIERVLREIRQGPLVLDEKLRAIALTINKL
jgi:hypothetical protein